MTRHSRPRMAARSIEKYLFYHQKQATAITPGMLGEITFMVQNTSVRNLECQA